MQCALKHEELYIATCVHAEVDALLRLYETGSEISLTELLVFVLFLCDQTRTHVQVPASTRPRSARRFSTFCSV